MMQRAPWFGFWLSLLVSCGGTISMDTSGQAGSAGSGGPGSGGPGTGGGGTGGTGGMGTTGTGGSAGASPPCLELVQTGELTQLPPLDQMAMQPRLHSLPSGEMAIVHYSPGPPTGGIATTNIAWKESWPPVVGSSVVLYESGFAAPVGRVGAGGLPLLTMASPVGAAFGFADPQQGGWSQLVSADSDAQGIRFLADDTNGNYLTGFVAQPADPDSWLYTLHVGWVGVNGTPAFVGPVDLGCMPKFSATDGVAVPGGWLVAHSHTDCSNGGNPPAITVTRFVDSSPQGGSEIPISGQVQKMVFVPRPAGAWLVYWHVPGLMAARLDALGNMDLGPLVLVPMGQPYPLGVDALDGGIIVAWAIDSDLNVATFDEQGLMITSTSLKEKDQAYYMAPQIAFDEASRQALIAISLPEGEGPHKLNVARLSCQ